MVQHKSSLSNEPGSKIKPKNERCQLHRNKQKLNKIPGLTEEQYKQTSLLKD
ncbi:hypothetical protein LguiB_021426 [Lonicera macranthoides]